MKNAPIFLVDAFTDRAFGGNPAAICLLDSDQDEHWMQMLAAEMNLSETAFVGQVAPDTFKLRWFTPKVEVDLCGHATLAAAHVLWEEGMVAAEVPINFETKSGTLHCTYHKGRIEMDFPATPVTQTDLPRAVAHAIQDALGIQAIAIGRNRFDILMTVHTEDEVRALAPNFHSLSKVVARGVMVTSRSVDQDYDFVSRFFAPAAGIDEDPVTGSAHCCLGPYWASVLGKSNLVGYQASGRGGIVHVRLADNRVVLGGCAVTVMRGKLAG